MHPIVESDPLGASPDTQRVGPSAADPLGAFVVTELATAARVGARGQRPVRSRRRLADLSARAEARIQPLVGLKPLERIEVQLGTFGLANHWSVPVEPER